MNSKDFILCKSWWDLMVKDIKWFVLTYCFATSTDHYLNFVGVSWWQTMIQFYEWVTKYYYTGSLENIILLLYITVIVFVSFLEMNIFSKEGKGQN